jgi:hypothetical protein
LWLKNIKISVHGFEEHRQDQSHYGGVGDPAIAVFDHNNLKENIRMLDFCSAIDEICFAIDEMCLEIDEMQNLSCPTHLESRTTEKALSVLPAATLRVLSSIIDTKNRFPSYGTTAIVTFTQTLTQFLRDCAGIRLWIRETIVIAPSSRSVYEEFQAAGMDNMRSLKYLFPLRDSGPTRLRGETLT